eukprot:TRINITY_DN1897_c0_g1_i5.p1 TRINITY_DN1897_c0_g1~~TRINITY_DN1897_c0_g1_i5.p1  ORF type:complete len:461 (+),score=104.02 TRINITY_DN1897_c0_g1_i5:649-2031(+)
MQPTVEEGHGLLYVEVFPLLQMEVTRHPRCKIVVGDNKVVTAATDQDRHWDLQCFYLEVESDHDTIKIDIADHNKLGKHIPLGKVDIALESVADGLLHDHHYPLLLHKVTSQSIRIRVQYLTSTQAHKNFQIAKKFYPQLREILLAPDLVILSTLCKVYDSNQVITTVVSFALAEHQVLSLLNQFVYREIRNTNSDQTLFRLDSPASKAVVAFLRVVGQPYLHEVMAPLLDQVYADASHAEMDPEHPKYTGEAPRKIERLVQEYLHFIFASAERCPGIIRLAFSNIKEMIAVVFPESQLKFVGAFLFLRFICPCIVSPHEFGLVKVPPTEEMKRLLRVVGKIIQNVANLNHFKEENMRVFDDIVDSNREKMLHFYSEMSSAPEAVEEGGDGEEDKVKDLAIILKHVGCNLPRILKEISGDGRCQGRPDKIAEEMTHYARLKILLEETALDVLVDKSEEEV